MARSFLLSTLIYVNTLVYGQFITPGTGVSWTFADLVTFSGGVVTVNNSIYTVHGNLTISLNDTLKIINNDHIRFNSNVLVTVNGTFIADPPLQCILTASNPEHFFKGFRFENTSSSVLRKCVIEFAGGIQVIGSNMLIEDCVIRFFNKSNTTGAIQVSQGRVRVFDDEIYQNKGPAIASAANALAAPQIFGNHIWSNNTDNTNMPQINLGNSGDDSIRIIGNTISGQFDQVGGIAVATLAGGNCFSIIENNIISNNRYGIAVIGNGIHAEIHGNVITDNDIQGNPNLGGSGINFNGGLTNTSMVSVNTISGNLWGITVQGTAMPNLGQRDLFITNPGENFIFDNGNEGTNYALYNNTPNSLKAQYNYWGTTNIDSVEMVIVHQPDNPSLGFVSYLPILIPVGNEVLPDPSDQENLILNVYPNPVSREGFVYLNRKLVSGPFVQYSILNLQGRKVNRGSATSHHDRIRINVSDIDAGLYFLNITTGAGMETRPIVVLR